MLDEGSQHRLSFSPTVWAVWWRRLERKNNIGETIRASPNLFFAPQFASFGCVLAFELNNVHCEVDSWCIADGGSDTEGVGSCTTEETHALLI